MTCFDTAAEAADYLDRRLDGKTVGHGGSITLKELGLLDRLQSHAVVRSHWLGDSFADAAAAPVYLTSVNALAETGDWAKHRRREHGAAAAWSARADEVTRILGTTGLY